MEHIRGIEQNAIAAMTALRDAYAANPVLGEEQWDRRARGVDRLMALALDIGSANDRQLGEAIPAAA